MAGYPARRHTARGIAHARSEPLCRRERPDPVCPCTACVAYFAAQERHRDAYERPAYGSGE